MIEAMLSDSRVALAGQDLKRGAGDAATPQPDGRNLGYTYVASNPMEHLAAAIQRAQGIGRMDRAQAEQQGQLGAKGQGVGTFWDLYRQGQTPTGQAQREAMDPFASVRDEGY
jgi:hypothetical protein